MAEETKDSVLSPSSNVRSLMEAKDEDAVVENQDPGQAERDVLGETSWNTLCASTVALTAGSFVFFLVLITGVAGLGRWGASCVASIIVENAYGSCANVSHHLEPRP